MDKIKGLFMNSQYVLEVKNLTKIYNGDRYAVNDVSFNVRPGMIFGFIGPNGAGKSTTIKMITGLTNITSGEIYICGQSVKKSFEKAIANVGGIIENPEMYHYLSGMDNLKFYASLYKGITKNKIMECVELVGLQNRIYDKVGKYSLGMKQRLGIAQALLHSPKLIILDEPTNGLDVNGIIEIRRLLKNLAHKQGVSIMVSSHILSEMEMLCDEIAIIVNGKIQQVKTLDEIKASQQSRLLYFVQVNYPNYAAKLIKQQFNIDAKLKSEIKDRIFFNCDKKLLPSIISHLVNKKILVSGAGQLDISLEDEFIEIVRQNTTDTSIN